MPELSAKYSPKSQDLNEMQIKMDGSHADMLLLLTSLVNSVSKQINVPVPHVCAMVAIAAKEEARARSNETVIDLSFLKNRGGDK